MTTELYYSSAWQVLEERIGGTATAQYMWSPVYVDALILRDWGAHANGTLDERRLSPCGNACRFLALKV